MADINSPAPDPDDPGDSQPRPPGGPVSGSGGWPNWQPPPASELSPTSTQQSLWKPAIISALLLLGFLYGNFTFAFGTSAIDQTFSTIFGIAMAVVPIVGIILCFPARTRRWGQGILLGIPLALGSALVIGAGLCVVLIAGGDF